MNSVVKMSVKRSMYSYFCIYLRPALKVFTFYANKVKPTFRRIKRKHLIEWQSCYLCFSVAAKLMYLCSLITVCNCKKLEFFLLDIFYVFVIRLCKAIDVSSTYQKLQINLYETYSRLRFIE